MADDLLDELLDRPNNGLELSYVLLKHLNSLILQLDDSEGLLIDLNLALGIKFAEIIALLLEYSVLLLLCILSGLLLFSLLAFGINNLHKL